MMLPPLSCHFIWPFYLICSSIKFHKIRSKCVGCIFALHGEYSMENCKWILLFGTFDTSKNCHNAISNNGTLLKTMLSTAITRKQPPVAATKEIISKNEYGYKLSHITYVRQQQLCLNKTKKKRKKESEQNPYHSALHISCVAEHWKFPFPDTIPSDMHTYETKRWIPPSRYFLSALFPLVSTKNEINYAKSYAKWKACREMNFIQHGAVCTFFSNVYFEWNAHTIYKNVKIGYCVRFTFMATKSKKPERKEKHLIQRKNRVEK